MNQNHDPNTCVPDPKKQLRFEPRDWLALAAALGLAVLWLSVFGLDTLDKSQYPPGLGAAAFVIAIFAAVLLYLGKDAKWDRWTIGLVAGVDLLTLACVIFGDVSVRLINFLLILCGSALALFSLSGSAENPLWKVRVIPETIRLTFRALFSNFGKPFRAAAALANGEKKSLLGVLIGLVIALPVLALVIYLLSTADAVFGGLFKGLTAWLNSIDAYEAAWRITRILLYTLLLFSAIYFLRHTPEKKGLETKKAHELTVSPFATVLILLDTVYLVFVVIQFTFLFGGAETAAMKGGFAEYARSGFFQLVAVSALNLAAVLITAAATGRQKVLQILSALLLTLTCVILFSAFWRMRLYISVYGMSLLRAMTIWAMAFIAVCLVLAAVRVFRPGFRFWPFFAAIGLAGWIIFNFINIDARIADYNVNAYLDGRLEEVDIHYLSHLSPDVLPALERLRADTGGDYCVDNRGGDSLDTVIENLEAFGKDTTLREWCLSYVRYQ